MTQLRLMWRKRLLNRYHEGKSLAGNIIHLCNKNTHSNDAEMTTAYTEDIIVAELKLNGIFSDRTLPMIENSKNFTAELRFLDAEMVEATTLLNKIWNRLDRKVSSL